MMITVNPELLVLDMMIYLLLTCNKFVILNIMMGMILGCTRVVLLDVPV